MHPSSLHRLQRACCLPLIFVMAGCSSDSPSEARCVPAQTMCFERPELILVCGDHERWEVEHCDDGMLCHEGACQELLCVPGSRSCEDDSVLICRDDGQGMLYPERCAEGETCHEGQCLERLCQANETRCLDEHTVERCEDNGTSWSTARTCAAGFSCVGEICLPSGCSPGDTECARSTLYECDSTGAWVGTACPDDQPCIFGMCVSCVSDHGCDEGEVCDQGTCVVSLPTLFTDSLPPGTEGHPYNALLEVSGGLPPYSFAVADGELPLGLAIFEDGSIAGTPTTAGTSHFLLRVTDSREARSEREYSLEIAPAGGDVRVATTAIPPAMHGIPYKFELQATGGALPYAWQALSGPLPAGIDLSSSGRLEGIPDEIGRFPLTMRVLDAMDPPSYDSTGLVFTVQIAPLEIVGDQEYDLLLTKVIVLPMLIPLVPYSEQLQAKGGLRPYTWNEEPAPSGLAWVPDWGIPSELTLSSDGKLRGWKTDISDATEISIPFTSIKLKGYFFRAKVTDSQDPSESIMAVFCIPTVPL